MATPRNAKSKVTGREVPAKLKGALRALRRVLGVHDVVTDGKKKIWVLSGPRTLRAGLKPRGRLWAWMMATHGEDRRRTVESYDDHIEVWDGWAGAINLGLGALGLGSEWTIQPVPGTDGLPRKNWSARKGRWQAAAPRPRFRFCEHTVADMGRANGPVLIDVAKDLPPLMLSHGISMAKLKEVRKCKGLLWPSFAMSWRVPPRFGDVFFFASTLNITRLLKPSGKARSNMYLAGTDIWSPDARELAHMEKAIEYELSGDEKWWDGERPPSEGGKGRRGPNKALVADGIAADDLVGRMSYWKNWQITEPLRSRRELVRRMRKLLAVYAKGGDPYLYTDRDSELAASDTPYPYGELKVSGLVKISDMPLAVYPRRVARSINKLLDEQEFTGVRMGVPWDGPLYADADEEQRREFAALVTRSVLAWAQRPCHTRGVKVGDALRAETWASTYNPTAWWISGKSEYEFWGPGYCATMDPGPVRTRRLSAPMRQWLANKQARPSAWGLERAEVVEGPEGRANIAELPGLGQWYVDAEKGRFKLSGYDARIGNELGWFGGEVAPGDVVIVLASQTSFRS